jgi:predicted O-methyltransferase YrrM
MASQINPLRQPFMSESVAAATRGRADRHARILEVGSWAGNSAILWADALDQLGLSGVVVCVDPWMPYEASSAQAVPGGMRAPLEDGTIYRLFLHNVAAAGHGGTIKPFRGYSDEVLPALRDQAFTLAYVDGSHAYAQVAKDLDNCARLVVNGGLLCGDDLECQMHQVDEAFAREMKDHDYVTDPRTGVSYHPGVAMAVAEFFGGPVSCYEGFWAMRKQDDEWKPVQLGAAPGETLVRTA